MAGQKVINCCAMMTLAEIAKWLARVGSPTLDVGCQSSEGQKTKRFISRPLRSTNTDDKNRQLSIFSGRLWPVKRMPWPTARKRLRILDRIYRIDRISMDWPEASPCRCHRLKAKVQIFTAKQVITFCPAIRAGQNFIS
jgi:hypothetical protein